MKIRLLSPGRPFLFKKGIDTGSSTYDDKYDVNGNGIIDTYDLDYIKDYLFAVRNPNLVPQSTVQFYTTTTNAEYQASSNTVIRTTRYEYDRAGNLIKETDCDGKYITYAYDAMNRLIRVTDKAGAVSRIFYDETDKVIKAVTPTKYNPSTDDGPGTTYVYDAMNRLVEIRNEENSDVRHRRQRTYHRLCIQQPEQSFRKNRRRRPYRFIQI